MKEKRNPGHAAGWIALTLTLTALLTACHRKEGPASKGKRQMGAVPVLVGKVIQKYVLSQAQAIGNVTAYSTVSVRSRVSGELLKAHFKEGDEVKKNDLLFTIDPRLPAAALRQAQANLVRDEAVLNQARQELDRERKLLDSQLISPDEFEKVEASWKTALAVREASRAAVTNSALNVEFTSIRSPLDGKTGSLLIQPGNQVNAESDVLVTITQVHPIYVVFSLPEKYLAEIRAESREKALTVEARLPDWPGPSPRGELTFIDNAVDMTTGTIQLKATFPNAENALWPGQFVQVTLTFKSLPQAIVVPSQAVQAGQDGDYVYIVKGDETVEMRPVQASLTFEGSTVVTNGLQPGETVVLDGQLRLGPGARVSIKTPGQPATTNVAPAMKQK
jgi:multidrug efflux system membrane fusion protein